VIQIYLKGETMNESRQAIIEAETKYINELYADDAATALNPIIFIDDSAGFVFRDINFTYYYKSLASLEDHYNNNFYNAANITPEIIENFKISNKLLKDLEIECSIDLKQMINCHEALIAAATSNEPYIPSFSEYIEAVKVLSKTNPTVNDFEIKDGPRPYYRTSALSGSIWKPFEPLLKNDIDLIIDLYKRFYEFPLYTKNNIFSYFPNIYENSCILDTTDQNNKLKLFNHKRIMIRLNYEIFNCKLFGMNDSYKLIAPVFNREIDTKLIKILNEYTPMEYSIGYSITEDLKSLFGL
jgi:hypothetical protein